MNKQTSAVGVLFWFWLAVALQAGAGPQPARRAGNGHNGFIQVGPTGRYFQFEGGAAFFAIGHNEWPRRFMLSNYSDADVDQYFANMQAHGENLLRLVLDWPAFPIEKPAGTFNPQFTRYLDRIVRSAERHDVYLMVAMWPNVVNLPAAFPLSWRAHSYSRRNGGPVASFRQFFRHPAALTLQQGRIRFFVDRWGRSDHIFAWELANEFDQDNDPWVNRMARYCKSYERSRYGKAHLVCVSVSSSSVGDARSAQWSCPNLDFATFHSYDKQRLAFALQRGPERFVNLTLLLPQNCARAVSKAGRRPVLDSEMPGLAHGPHKKVVLTTVSDEVIDEAFLAGGWAYMCSGAAGAGLRWPATPLFQLDGKPNALGPRMYDFQLALRRFADLVDWNRIDPMVYSQVKATSSDGRRLRVIATISRDRRRAIGWLLDRLGATDKTQATVTLADLAGEAHNLSWFDDRTGRELKSEPVNGPAFTVKTPPFLGHVGFLIEPTAASRGPADHNQRADFR